MTEGRSGVPGRAADRILQERQAQAEEEPKPAKPRTASLFKSMDLATVTLERGTAADEPAARAHADAEAWKSPCRTAALARYLKRARTPARLAARRNLHDYAGAGLRFTPSRSKHGRAAAKNLAG